MNKILRGRAWKFGDNIDTDIITPSEVTAFGLGDQKEQRLVIENAFKPIRDNFYKLVKRGDILVAGRNFGFGSHREQANKVLPLLGFSCVVAESVARIYFRNSIAIGFPIFEVPGITWKVEDGNELEVDMNSWKLKNLSSTEEISLEPYPSIIQEILETGGILRLLKQGVK